MENRKSVKIIFLFFLPAVFVSPFFAFAYDNNTAHRALTQETIELFNHNYPNLKLSSSKIDIVIKGIKDEDTPPRWINHFYDLVNKEGRTGENTGVWPEFMVQSLSGVLLSSNKQVSSLNWLHNQKLYKNFIISTDLF